MSEGHRTPALTGEQIDHILAAMADSFGQQLRSPVLHWPDEQGLDYQDVTFPALDGAPLEGWFIPAPGSDKLIIANHPMGFSRSGIPAHLEPWRSVWASSGNDFEVNLVPDYKILHDAGYNVLAYDLRNSGLSGAANGGIASSGIFEARDVAGSLAYARSRPDTRDMTIGLFSRCLGCSSTFAAMTQFPAAFDGVRCLVGPAAGHHEDHRPAAAGPAGSTGRPHRRPRAARDLADEHRVRPAGPPGVGQERPRARLPLPGARRRADRAQRRADDVRQHSRR